MGAVNNLNDTTRKCNELAEEMRQSGCSAYTLLVNSAGCLDKLALEPRPFYQFGQMPPYSFYPVEREELGVLELEAKGDFEFRNGLFVRQKNLALVLSNLFDVIRRGERKTGPGWLPLVSISGMDYFSGLKIKGEPLCSVATYATPGEGCHADACRRFLELAERL